MTPTPTPVDMRAFVAKVKRMLHSGDPGLFVQAMDICIDLAEVCDPEGREGLIKKKREWLASRSDPFGVD